MPDYEVPVADPPLTRVERLMFQLICGIRRTQSDYRFFDPHEPPLPNDLRLLFRAERAMRDWQKAYFRYVSERGGPRVRDPLPLSQLWSRTKPPRRLAPSRVEAEDLFFESFLVSQRFGVHGNGGELSYVVGAPVAEESFRCIALESSGRSFSTVEPKTRCTPPSADDFVRLDIRSKGFDLRGPPTGVPTIPTVMDLYLPGCYGPWRLLRTPHELVEESMLDS